MSDFADKAQVDRPVEPNARLGSIDVLRGIAILGIFLMNVQSFAMPDLAYVNPRLFGDYTGANALVHQIEHVFVSGKFISIFSMLFGAGIALQARRGQRASTHLRRMAVLLVIGLLHAYLVWHGDVLVSYAMIGALVFLFRDLRPRAIFTWAAGLFTAGLVLNAALAGLVMLAVNYSGDPAIREAFAPSPAVLQAEVDAFRGSWLDQMPYRASSAAKFQTFLFVFFSLPYVTALMLLGMAITRLGIFDGTWPARRLATVAITCCLIGWPIAASQLFANASLDHDPVLVMMVTPMLNTLAMPLVAVGYTAAVCLLVMKLGNAFALWPLAAIGRTALSCYLLESVIGTLLFYGHGLGWYGSVDRLGQLGVALCVWIVLLIVAPLWLRFFRQGPMEWVWRRLAYAGNAKFERQKAK